MLNHHYQLQTQLTEKKIPPTEFEKVALKNLKVVLNLWQKLCRNIRKVTRNFFIFLDVKYDFGPLVLANFGNEQQKNVHQYYIGLIEE